MHRSLERRTGQPGAAPRRARTRRLLFALLAVAVVVGTLEATALALYALLPGEGFSYARLARARAARAPAAEATGIAPKAFQDSAGDTCIHPYLGFVLNRENDDQLGFPALGYGVTRYGFIDDGEPVRRREPGKVLVGIFGGSVAQFFGDVGARELARRLREHPAFASRRIEFVRLGVAGFKQPQQVMALTYLLSLGGELDIAINLDGFNEATLGPLENVPRGVASHFPRNWALLAEHAPDALQRRLIGTATVLHDAQRTLAEGFAGAPWRWSIAASLLWENLDRWLDRAANRQLRDLQQHRRRDQPFYITGPGTDGAANAEAVSVDSVATWARCSRAMHAMCVAHGIRYFHFLQPNQYLPASKPFSPAELAGAFDPQSRYRPWIERGYPRMRAAGAQLAAEGIAFVDLTQLFADVSEPAYCDVYCHFNDAGNRRIGQAIADAIRTATPDAEDSPRRLPDRLCVEPPAIRFTQPLARRALRVLGCGSGSEHDLTYWSATRYESSDPTIVTVDEYGTLTAIGHGEATVTVRCGSRCIAVPVAVQLPAVVDLGGAYAPPPWQPPALHGDGSEGRLRLRLTPPGADLPGAVGFVAEPALRAFCGGHVVVPLQAPATQTIGASGGPVDVDAISPLPGRRTIYVQAIYRTGGETCGFAVSNALAITR